MVTCTKRGDMLKADKVICEARKVSPIRVINKSGRHKANSLTLYDNVKCIIEREVDFIK